MLIFTKRFYLFISTNILIKKSYDQLLMALLQKNRHVPSCVDCLKVQLFFVAILIALFSYK
ncbi:hypothetical protein CW304_10130 [Bacillus sp. UFRGS-B20]|nr:hypothetical protein CW304_10130 [Bacillus sp. UFRGS-B20]